MELRDYQTAAVNSVYSFLRERATNPCVVLPTAAGKCLGRGTPVLMFDGTVRPVEEVEVGDLLMGPDSRPRTVLALGRGREMLYEVRSRRGDVYVVNESHILSLKLTPEDKGQLHRIVNIPLRDYLASTTTFKHRAKGYRVGVDFPTAPVPIDPYYLGLWLADGDQDRPSVSKPDIEVAASVREYAGRLGLSMRTNVIEGKCPSCTITAGREGARAGRNPLLNELRNLGLIRNKHIPHVYLANSRSVRLQILAGLLDGDGSRSDTGYDFSSTEERIADGVIFLARSLGFSASKTARETQCQTGAWCHSYRVYIGGRCQEIPCRIARRKIPPNTKRKDATVYGISVEPVGVGDYFGFEIDGDRLFMLGDFTVTHNTPVIATLCRDAVGVWNGRVLILAHVKELLQQNAEKLQLICPTIKIGIYSAGLKRRDTTQSVIIAGIQSVHDKADQLGAFDLVIVDEAHLIGEEGMYRKLIADLQEINPDLRVIGLTATPYRLSSGPICTPEGILNEVCYEISVKVLMNRGFLSKMVSKSAENHIDTSPLKIVRGEYDPAQTEAAFGNVVVQATEEILEKTQDRKSVLIFCQNIAHARQVFNIIRKKDTRLAVEAARQLAPAQAAGLPSDDLFGKLIAADFLDDAELPSDALRYSLGGAFSCAEIYGDTPGEERAEILARFKAGEIKYLVNVNVLTTGFDAPNIDAVALLRSTVSPGLYYQMVGRGFRIHEFKKDCLILDFGENVKRHGPVDCIRMRIERKAEDAGKECPECHSVMARNASACTDCGYVWEVSERRPTSHAGKSSNDDIVSGDPKTEARDVMSVTYKIHTKKNAVEGAPKTFRVTYQLSFSEYQSEWICVEHPPGSFAHGKAKDWWERRCYLPMPRTAVEACAIASQGWLAQTESISVKTDPKKDFPEIVKHTLGDIPRTIPPCPKCGEGCSQVVLPNENDTRYPGKVVCASCSYLYRYASAGDIEVYGILDSSTNDRRNGEIVYTLDTEDLPPEKNGWDDYETPDIPF